MSTDVAPVRAAVARVLGRLPLEHELSLRPAIPHQRNRLHEIRADGVHLIAKEYLATDEREAPGHEYAALRLVEPLDIAPRPVFFDPHVGPVVIYAFLDGTMWDRDVPTPAQLAALAEVWIRLHAVPIDGLWLATGQARPWSKTEARLRAPIAAYAAWVERQAPHRRRAAQLCLEALERALAITAALIPVDAPRCFCRSDPRFANVIARPDGRLGLVDWEDSGLRDPAREVADLLLHPNQEDLLDWPAWRAFLDPYVASRRGDRGFGDRLHGYLAIFPVFWLGLLLRDGLDRLARDALQGWRVNGLAPNDRLRRYLARCLAWPEPDPAAALATLGDVVFF
jgi:hypothetical protein